MDDEFALPLHRRSLMTTGLAAAITPMLPLTDATLVTKAKTGPSVLFTLPPPPQAPSLAAPPGNAWRDFKNKYSALPRFNWLAALNETVDDIVYNALIGAPTNSIPPYDPYHFERLISITSNLLDRCLVYRKEMYDLEEQAVRRALDYQLYTDQHDPQRDIELAPNIQDQRKRERLGQSAAVARFDKADDDYAPLAKGFQEIAKATAESCAIAEQYETVRRNNVQRKWQALDDYQAALEARHSTPGNALNYQERFQRVKTLLQQDIASAYLRMRCIEKAVVAFYGLPVAVAAPTQSGYLDYLVLTHRDIIDRLEIESQNEVDFDHVIPLHQGRWNKSTNSSRQIIDDSIWAPLTTVGGSGVLNFDLTANEFPPAVLKVRMRGMALSCASVSPEKQESRFKSFSAIVFPPKPPDFFSAGSTKERNPIVIENVAIAETGSTRISESYDPILNVDPRGTWTIQLSDNSLYPDGTARERNKDDDSRLVDLRLHLRLRAVLDNKPSSWTGLSW